MEKNIRVAVTVYLTTSDDIEGWKEVQNHYNEPERSDSSIFVQLLREKVMAIRGGETKRQQLSQIGDGVQELKKLVSTRDEDIDEILSYIRATTTQKVIE